MQQFATCLQQGRRVRAYAAQSGFYGRAVEATTPKRALGNITPLRCCDTDVGAREVEALLGRIEHGVFS